MKLVATILFILAFNQVRAQWKINVTKIDSVLTYLHERQLFNGAILIGEKGKVLYKKAFGIAGVGGKRLTTASAFNLASVSKQFFSMMVMILKEQGKLGYDDAVRKFLPSFPYEEITIRQLMNHTSGLPEYFDLAAHNMTFLDTLTNESMLALLAEKKPSLVSKPGDVFSYCNTNYTTLASVIAAVTGISCDEFFASRIARPLKLRNTYIYNLTMKSYPESRVFGFHYENGKPVLDDLLPLDGIVGDGNVYSSVEDLYKWDQALYTEKLVSKATFSEAIAPGKLNDGSFSNYGFGWGIKAKDVEVDHSGGWVAFGTYIDRYIAANQTYILLDNSASSFARGIVKNILEGKPYVLPVTQLINNVKLIDGTGSPSRAAAVRIVNSRIRDLGNLSAFRGEEVIDGKGHVLAPGFIDSHSHHEWSLDKDPSAIAATNQGITTIVIGQDGGSMPVDSLEARIKRRPSTINIATYTGHASLREKYMKDVFRAANDSEIEKMKESLLTEMDKGSLGLSTGLEYEEGFYSTMDEVIELAKVAGSKGGRYISHVRSEDINLERSIEEIITIGREARIPVQISHIKIAMRSKWGNSGEILSQLSAARTSGINITADCYPYALWVSTPRVLFPKKDFTNLESALYATQELFDPLQSIVLRFPAHPDYEGKSVAQVAEMNKETPALSLIRLIKESKDSGVAIAGASMDEADIRNFLRWSQTNICSDGSDGGHPRGYGAFTRILGRYVREQKIMDLETAIHKMTGLTAEHLGIRRRGLITRHYFADLVLFDPETVLDNATMAKPKALSSGIEMVWVNGKVVYRAQESTASRPGVLIRRGE